MTYEVEQKFPVADLAAIAVQLDELGAEPGRTVQQVDTYFAHPSRDYADTDEALRIRRVGADNFITYKGPKIDAETKTRREIELPLPGGESAAAAHGQLLEALGFSPVATVSKTRTSRRLERQGWTIEVALDQLAVLGSYVELELQAGDADIDAARGIIQALACQLGLIESERLSYLEMLLGGRSESGDS